MEYNEILKALETENGDLVVLVNNYKKHLNLNFLGKNHWSMLAFGKRYDGDNTYMANVLNDIDIIDICL